MGNTSISIKNIEALRKVLKEHKIDTSLYGVDKANSVNDLWKEIEKKNCYLVKTPEGLLRVSLPTEFNIFYIKNNERYKLHRTETIDEKSKAYSMKKERYVDGNIEESIKKSIKEELDVDLKSNISITSPSVFYGENTVLYPGIKDITSTSKVEIIFSEEEWKENYKSCFAWKKM